MSTDLHLQRWGEALVLFRDHQPLTSPGGSPFAVHDPRLALQLLEETQDSVGLVPPCLRDLLSMELDRVHGRQLEAVAWVADRVMSEGPLDTCVIRPRTAVIEEMLSRAVYPRAHLAVAMDFMHRFHIAPPELLWPVLDRDAFEALLERVLPHRTRTQGICLQTLERRRDIARTYDLYLGCGGAAEVDIPHRSYEW